MESTAEKEHAYKLIDQLGPGQLAAVVQLLEIIVDPVAHSLANAPFENEEISEEEERAVAEAKDWIKQNPGKSIPHEKVLADCGLTMEDFRKMGEGRAAKRRT